MKILITGATGFIGNELINEFQQANYDISILTRNRKKVKKNFLTIYEHPDEISENKVFDSIINLAGAPISQRWSKNYKKQLIESRINVTRGLYDLVKRLRKTPKMLISASAVGYYGNQGELELTEESNPVKEFTHELCMIWEKEALKLQDFAINIAIIRLGIVLGSNGGILKETTPIFKKCLGGRIGIGNQYLSWIHIFDVVQSIKFLLLNNDVSGIYNLTSPFPVTNKYWTKSLAKVLNRPAIMTLPSFVVKAIFGEMGESLLLNGQKVIPQRLLDAGFNFKYKKVEDALYNIFS